MAGEPLEIEADVVGGDPARPSEVTVVRGQHRVASTYGRVTKIRLLPSRPMPCPEALGALEEAEWVFLGPGSWFTSVLPHVLVPDVRAALEGTSARRVLNLNLDVHRGETKGFRAVDHLTSLAEHAPGLRLDVVLADPSVLDDADEVAKVAGRLGARLVSSPVAASARPGQHDALRLAAAYRDLMG